VNESDFLSRGLADLRRIVIKVGTNLLRGDQEGLDLDFMDQLAVQIGRVNARGVDVILVSSGSVGAGAYVMGFEEPPADINARQALAAVGQSRLMHHYKGVFKGHGIKVAQVLLTRNSMDNRKRYLNARTTFETLLDWNVLPIVNENDTVAIEELTFGDNDQLSALIAAKVDAELLVLLTDVDGLYDRPPSEQGARRIPVIHNHRELPQVRYESPAAGNFSLGGMRSKLEAVRLATRTGILTFIGPGRLPDILIKALDGEDVGTWCEPNRRKIPARKRWLALGKRWGGARIEIDAGAEKALLADGKSLLPSGVVTVEQEFEAGDLVSVCCSAVEIARGLVRYSSGELDSVKGMKTGEITRTLGERQSYEVIHRDDMVLLHEGN
jgi:glutamate 5-kinase